VKVKNAITRVLVEKISIDKSIFVKFELIEDQLVIKLNSNHAAIASKNKLFDVYKKDEYWILIGEALFSNLGKIKEIEKLVADGITPNEFLNKSPKQLTDLRGALRKYALYKKSSKN
jgi:hypothetical protein